MTGLGSGFFLAFFAGFFLIRRNGGGGSGGMSLVAVGGFEGECGELHQGEDHDGFALGIEEAGGFFIETVFYCSRLNFFLNFLSCPTYRY